MKTKVNALCALISLRLLYLYLCMSTVFLNFVMKKKNKTTSVLQTNKHLPTLLLKVNDGAGRT